MTSGDSPRLRIPPYAITGGRTTSSITFAIESIVRSTTAGLESDLKYEKGKILDLCKEPLSIAELSAHIQLPIQVIKILVGDLIEESFLDRGSSGTAGSDGVGRPDLQLLERVLGGLQNL